MAWFKFKKKNRKQVRGFTLVELLVSVFIFSIVMTISMGSLLVLIDANSKGQGVQAVLTNISFALDSMTRNIRTGTSYYCDDTVINNGEPLPADEVTKDCTGKHSIIYTDGRTGNRVGFRYNSDEGSIERKIDVYDGNGKLKTKGDWLRVTSPQVFVTNFLVNVVGAEVQSDTIQPTAHIFVEGYIVNENDTKPDFQLQTTITQRILDF